MAMHVAGTLIRCCTIGGMGALELLKVTVLMVTGLNAYLLNQQKSLRRNLAHDFIKRRK